MSTVIVDIVVGEDGRAHVNVTGPQQRVVDTGQIKIRLTHPERETDYRIMAHNKTGAFLAVEAVR